jgi:zinc protease
MGMLDEGAGDLDALAFADRAEALGANLGAGAGLDGSSAYLSALKQNLEPSVALYADMLRKPRFEQAEIDRVKASGSPASSRKRRARTARPMRVLPPLLYGAGHPYAIPFSGSGTEASIAALTRDDLVGFHRQRLRPEGATLIVVGDTTLARSCRCWRSTSATGRRRPAPRPKPSCPAVALPKKPRVFLIDQPGAVQANIVAGQLAPSSMDPPPRSSFDIANAVLGGEFTSRLNMNLREDKHWAYGATAAPPMRWASAVDGVGGGADRQDRRVGGRCEREIADYASGKQGRHRRGSQRHAEDPRPLSLPGAYETAAR